MQPLAPGAALLDGRFVIVRLIAHGGQATTYEGIDKRDGQQVAIKRFVVRGASGWKDVELAEREARVLSSLSHPGIPRHVAHFEEQGELYLVTEFIEGETLDNASRRSSISGTTRSPFTQQDVVAYLFAIAALLDYLQAQSPPIIHRDIKPKNVIRRRDGSFVLVDFGSVRDHLRSEGGSTVVGTFGYMAPEQFQGRALPATDTYAAAATALALLTGRDPDQLPHQGLKLDVDKALGDTVSSELKRVLKSALEPDPDRRAQRLSTLLATSTLGQRNTGSTHQAYERKHASHQAGSSEHARAQSRHQETPFRTEGYQRARRSGPHENDAEHPIVDLETPLQRALTDSHVQRWLRIPVVALVLTILLVLVRTALWFALGVVVPAVLMIVHRAFNAPVLTEARRTRHVARQMRNQMRRVSRNLAASTHPELRFRVETGVPGRNVGARSSSAEFVRQLDEEAFELEAELDERVEKLRRK